MANNRFAHLYEEATIDVARHTVGRMLGELLPPLKPDMHVLDLGCGPGSATKVIYEQCAARGIQPPKITAIDIGDNFIAVFNENKAALNWHTAEGILGDASDLKPCRDSSFDMVIMSFSLFAIKDEVSDKAAAEVYRVLKPGGRLVASTWRESWVERMVMGANKAVGRPEEDVKRFNLGKWSLEETPGDVLRAGGFEAGKIRFIADDFYQKFARVGDLVEHYNTPFWLGIGATNWTEEERRRWPAEIEKLLTEEEKRTVAVPMCTRLWAADK